MDLHAYCYVDEMVAYCRGAACSCSLSSTALRKASSSLQATTIPSCNVLMPAGLEHGH